MTAARGSSPRSEPPTASSTGRNGAGSPDRDAPLSTACRSGNDAPGAAPPGAFSHAGRRFGYSCRRGVSSAFTRRRPAAGCRRPDRSSKLISEEGAMNREEILQTPSMPLASPSYPHGPYRFVNREYFIIVYESDPAAVRAAVPEPLEPGAENLVYYEWIRMPDSSGFGDYTESGVVIPCDYQGKHINFTAQMYLDDEPPIAAGREIWGFPKKHAEPKLEIVHDTLTGTLQYAGQLVAMGSM